MKNAIIRALSAIGVCFPLYTFSPTKWRADDRGCQAPIRLSNPGVPPQYNACRPPTERLRAHLAEGRSLSICRAYRAARPDIRERSHHIDLTIDTATGQRGWR